MTQVLGGFLLLLGVGWGCLDGLRLGDGAVFKCVLNNIKLNKNHEYSQLIIGV